MHSSTDQFRAARDLLLDLRTEYDEACKQVIWPRPGSLCDGAVGPRCQRCFTSLTPFPGNVTGRDPAGVGKRPHRARTVCIESGVAHPRLSHTVSEGNCKVVTIDVRRGGTSKLHVDGASSERHCGNHQADD